MAILSSSELKVAEAIGAIGYFNPFLPERLALERAAHTSNLQQTVSGRRICHQ